MILALLLLSACGSPDVPRPGRADTPAAKVAPPKITMFYAAEPAVPPGSAATLCYGTESASKVTISPAAVAPLAPSLNRCVEVKPARTTTYTLTAANDAGVAATQTIEVRVDPKARVTGTAVPQSAVAPGEPHIHYFRVDSSRKEGQQTYHKLCFMTENAEKVELSPAVIPVSKVTLGCFDVSPASSTEYVLTVTGKGGRQVSKSLRVSP